MNFEQNIQHWVKIDNQIKILNQQIKTMREQKHQLLDKINTYVASQNLTNRSVQISDGQLKFVQTQSTQSLTLRFINDCLSEIIKDQSQVEMIMNHIKKKRTVKINPNIRRYYN